jgi:catechol 2,3-dioxygenase-like lactoylglutathione lyase family enzyme
MRKGVMRPGHVQIRVMDIDEAVVHYRDRLGMIEVKRDDQNRAYFKGWTEIDAFSVVRTSRAWTSWAGKSLTQRPWSSASRT